MSGFVTTSYSCALSEFRRMLIGAMALFVLTATAGCGSPAAPPLPPTQAATAAAAPAATAALKASASPTATLSLMPGGAKPGGAMGAGLSITAKPQYADVAYATASATQKLDVYLPQGNGPFPLIIAIHAGGFMVGDKKQVDGVDQLLAQGYAVASINYRLSAEAKAPAQIQDAKAAVRFLRAHAQEYKLNTQKFGAWGASAGGNLVAMLGTSCGVAALEGADLGNADQSSCVQAVVDWFGPTDFLQMDQQFTGTSCPVNHNDASSPESQLIGAAIQTKPELAKAANPITYVSAKAPPFFIQHGTADCNVPPQQSQLLADALKSAIGADKVTLTFLQGAGHGGSQFSDAANLKQVLDFLNKYLKSP